MQIITLAIQKGGTAKTSSAAALAQAAAYRGDKVLAIDLDPQGNLSFCLAADTTRAGSLELLEGTPARKITQATAAGIDVIPASMNLATIQSGTGSAKRLQKALEPIRGKYDLIIVDTPSKAGELQYNALQAATGLIVPLQAETFSLQGLYQIIDTAEQFKPSNPALTYKGIIFTRHNPRNSISRQLQEVITARAAEMDIPTLGAIREAVAVREAQALQESLYKYAPKSKPAQDYLAIYDKIMEA